MTGELQIEGVFGKVLKKAFRTKREELTGGWIKIAKRNLTIFTSHQILFGCSNQGN